MQMNHPWRNRRRSSSTITNSLSETTWRQSASTNTAGSRSNSTSSSLSSSSSIHRGGVRRQKSQDENTNNSTASASLCLPLYECMEKKKWWKVHKLLKRHIRRKELHAIADGTGLTPLAYAVSCRAPIHILEVILQADPDSTLKTDDFGASPLHLACLNGTTYETVKMVLDFDKGESVKLIDKSACSVLHHAVEFACAKIEKKYQYDHENENDDDGSSSSSSSSGGVGRSLECLESTSETVNECESLKVVQLLCNVVPDHVFFAAQDGATPLDIPNIFMINLITLAKEYNYYNVEVGKEITDDFMRVYKIVKGTAVDLYRRRKLEWESQQIPSQILSPPGEGNASASASANNSNKNKAEPGLNSLASSIVSAPTNTLSRGSCSQNLSLFKDSLAGTASGSDPKFIQKSSLAERGKK